MITFRRPSFDDLGSVTVRNIVQSGVLEGGRSDAVDWAKIWAMCRMLVAGPHHHIELAFDGDDAVAYIGALRGATWFEKDRFSMVGWYSKHAGAGMTLLRRLVARSRRDGGIGGILVIVNGDAGGRVAAMVQRRYGGSVVPTFNIDL